MKVAIIGSKDFDSLEYHLHDSLEFLGHQVFHIDIKDVIKIPYRYNYWATKLFPSYDELIFKKIAEKVIEQEPDLVIATYRFIHPVCIRMIKQNLKAKVIHINPDQMTTLEHQQIFASDYDAWFTKEKYMLDFMQNKMRLNAHYFPEALNPRVHKPSAKNRNQLEKEIDIDVVTFGTMYPYRSRMVSELIKADINVVLFGIADKRFARKEIAENFRNEFITGERKAEVLCGSKIVFNNFHYAEVNSANVKFFEIGGIGAFQLCDYKPVLEEYSKIDVEKFTYRHIDEAIEKVRYYLDKPEERYALSDLQRQHFIENHTYDVRLTEMLKLIHK